MIWEEVRLILLVRRQSSLKQREWPNCFIRFVYLTVSSFTSFMSWTQGSKAQNQHYTKYQCTHSPSNIHIYIYIYIIVLRQKYTCQWLGKQASRCIYIHCITLRITKKALCVHLICALLRRNVVYTMPLACLHTHAWNVIRNTNTYTHYGGYIPSVATVPFSKFNERRSRSVSL